MTTQHLVPEDFPREPQAGSVTGAQPKLLVRKVGGQYVDGLTPEELYERYAAVEDLAQQLAIYTRRKIDTKGWDCEEALHQVKLGVENKVRSGTWDFSDAEISWLMSRTRQVLLHRT